MPALWKALDSIHMYRLAETLLHFKDLGWTSAADRRDANESAYKGI